MLNYFFYMLFTMFFLFVPINKSANVQNVDSKQHQVKDKKQPPVTIQDSKIPDPSELPPDGL